VIDTATAQAVTFNKDIRCKSVTLDGDSFDPQGTVSGMHSSLHVLVVDSDLATCA
jgi:chromosome segregation ATPase